MLESEIFIVASLFGEVSQGPAKKLMLTGIDCSREPSRRLSAPRSRGSSARSLEAAFHRLDTVEGKDGGPKDHVSIWILHPGSKAQDKGGLNHPDV